MRLFASLLILLVAFFSFKSNQPKTHWYSMGLKGKVKTLEFIFITNKVDTVFTQKHYFSKNGILQTLEMSELKNSPYSYSFTYDQDGFTKSITHKSELGTILTKWDFTKNISGDTTIIKSKIIYNISKSNAEYENYYVDYLLVKTKNFNPLPYQPEILEFQYDDRQWEIQTRYYLQDGLKDQFYTYEKVDRKGNWTQRKIYETDSTSSIPIIQVRKISYY